MLADIITVVLGFGVAFVALYAALWVVLFPLEGWKLVAWCFISGRS